MFEQEAGTDRWYETVTSLVSCSQVIKAQNHISCWSNQQWQNVSGTSGQLLLSRHDAWGHLCLNSKHAIMWDSAQIPSWFMCVNVMPLLLLSMEVFDSVNQEVGFDALATLYKMSLQKLYVPSPLMLPSSALTGAFCSVLCELHMSRFESSSHSCNACIPCNLQICVRGLCTVRK